MNQLKITVIGVVVALCIALTDSSLGLVAHTVLVPLELFVLEHHFEAIVSHERLYVRVLLALFVGRVLVDQLIHKLLVDSYIGVKSFLFCHLDAFTLLAEALLDLVLLEFLVGEGVVGHHEFLVGLQLHEITMHVAFEYLCANQMRCL